MTTTEIQMFAIIILFTCLCLWVIKDHVRKRLNLLRCLLDKSGFAGAKFLRHAELQTYPNPNPDLDLNPNPHWNDDSDASFHVDEKNISSVFWAVSNRYNLKFAMNHALATAEAAELCHANASACFQDLIQQRGFPADRVLRDLKRKTKTILAFTQTVDGGRFVLSCVYICVCNFAHVKLENYGMVPLFYRNADAVRFCMELVSQQGLGGFSPRVIATVPERAMENLARFTSHAGVMLARQILSELLLKAALTTDDDQCSEKLLSHKHNLMPCVNSFPAIAELCHIGNEFVRPGHYSGKLRCQLSTTIDKLRNASYASEAPTAPDSLFVYPIVVGGKIRCTVVVKSMLNMSQDGKLMQVYVMFGSGNLASITTNSRVAALDVATYAWGLGLGLGDNHCARRVLKVHHDLQVNHVATWEIGLCPLMCALMSEASDVGASLEVITVGHSVGGALASLTAMAVASLALRLDYGICVMTRVVTVGCPHVFSDAVVDDVFRKRVHVHYHICSRADVVPFIEFCGFTRHTFPPMVFGKPVESRLAGLWAFWRGAHSLEAYGNPKLFEVGDTAPNWRV